MWIYNGRALVCVVLGGVVAALTVAAKLHGYLAMSLGTVAAMGVDFWMRITSEDGDNALIDPRSGGHIWFAPIWFVGIVFLVIIGLMYFEIV